jgi:hypothetical protein
VIVLLVKIAIYWYFVSCSVLWNLTVLNPIARRLIIMFEKIMFDIITHRASLKAAGDERLALFVKPRIKLARQQVRRPVLSRFIAGPEKDNPSISSMEG